VVNASAKEDEAFGGFMGIFWCIFQLSNVFGNLVTY